MSEHPFLSRKLQQVPTIPFRTIGKRLAFIVLSLLTVFCATAFSAPLLIAVEDDAAPWSQHDGTGFANEVVLAAFEAAGVPVEFSVVPYSRCKDMALKGTSAACLSMAWLPEFSGKIVFADKPLFVCFADYFADIKKPMKAARQEDLPKGTLVGVVSGYEYPPAVYTLQKKGILVFEESESEELNLKKLAKGRLDFALLVYNEMKPAELLLARAGVTGQVKQAFRSGMNNSYIGFSTTHPQGMKALEKFNAGYRIISSNGTLDQIEKKWRVLAVTEATGVSGNIQK